MERSRLVSATGPSSMSPHYTAMLKRVFAILPLGILLRSLLMAEPSAAPTASAASQPILFRVFKDVAYQSAEPTERADLYLPTYASAQPPSPGIVWMHGNHHDKADARERNICSNLAG